MLLGQGDLDAAISSYNTALKLKPNYPEAHNNLGTAFNEQGDLDTAISSYNTALKLKPNTRGSLEFFAGNAVAATTRMAGRNMNGEQEEEKHLNATRYSQM